MEEIDLPSQNTLDTGLSRHHAEYTLNLTGVKGGSMQEYRRNHPSLAADKLAENARVLPMRLLLRFPQLVRVNVADDFVTCAVGEEEEMDWDAVAQEIEQILRSNPLLFTDGAASSSGLDRGVSGDEVGNKEEDGSEATALDKEIMELLETNVRPNLRLDGGDVVYKGAYTVYRG